MPSRLARVGEKGRAGALQAPDSEGFFCRGSLMSIAPTRHRGRPAGVFPFCAENITRSFEGLAPVPIPFSSLARLENIRCRALAVLTRLLNCKWPLEVGRPLVKIGKKKGTKKEQQLLDDVSAFAEVGTIKEAERFVNVISNTR